MAGNSFLLKGWAVTLVAGLSAFVSTGSDRGFAWIAAGVAVVFALLDAFYLAIERSYRKLYAQVIKETTEVSDWTLEAEPVGPGEVLKALGGFAIWPLYTAVLAGAAAVALSA